MLLADETPKITDWMQAWGTLIGATLTVAAVVLTGLLLRHEIRAARQAREMADEEARPYVIVDFDFRGVIVLLVIQNIGRSIAHDVEINFDPPLASKAFDFDDVQALKGPIRMMAPGRKIPFFFDSVLERSPDAGLPDSYSVSISYRDSAGTKYDDPPYTLDLQTFLGTAMPPNGLPELVGHVRDMRDEMRKWRRYGTPLFVRTIDHRAEAERSREALEKQKAKRVSEVASEPDEEKAEDESRPPRL
ncbi:hypothetical protein [Catelliglobosispora koreensis]|uniref:hypothetical protein n=1 Tax=Catelliglobosispora koreensis TaxID=129052 RepID=UPI00047725CF|nr:hypothetical protein [Catelliglobosispora koreensis]